MVMNHCLLVILLAKSNQIVLGDVGEDAHSTCTSPSGTCSSALLQTRQKIGKVLGNEKSCGIKGRDDSPFGKKGDFQAHIVNGQDATECEWKWQASLRSKDGSNAFCGGALIHPNWVFTAAHCVADTTPDKMKIVLGDLNRETEGKNESSHAVKRIISHHDYTDSPPDYDYALIELAKPAPEDHACIGTVCIPEEDAAKVEANQNCIITGWGYLKENGDQPKILQEAQVKTLSNEACNKQYGGVITNSMLCAQGRNAEGAPTDACQGDSGGPLVCQRNGKWYLEGATSWGRGCANPKYAGIWARLTHVTSWTKKVLSGGAVPTSKPTKPAPSPGFTDDDSNGSPGPTDDDYNGAPSPGPKDDDSSGAPSPGPKDDDWNNGNDEGNHGNDDGNYNDDNGHNYDDNHWGSD